jgi:hypothetical protein
VAITEALDREPASALVAYELGLAQEAKGLVAEALITWRHFLDRESSAPDSDGWQVKISEAVSRVRTTMAAAPLVPTAIPITIK